MSDEAGRPLTRRERRLREMEETGGIPTVDGAGASVSAERRGTGNTASEESIEISPFNEDGTPRTRREIRELRARALEALAAESGGGGEYSAPVEPEPEQNEDSTGLPPDLEATQPFSRSDLEEIARDQAAAQQVSEEPAPADEVAVDDPQTEVVPESSGSDSQQAPEDAADASPKKAYTFPDIAPLDETVSVFDDPSAQPRSTPAAEGGSEFDDLISRAVAQEGNGGTKSGSALILPNLIDTGELSGPIGDTGELFITGSIELPKSLGETGSHAPLHDSHDADPLSELGLDEIPTSDDVNSPVAAKRAVSAVSAGDAVISQETKEKSKLPLALILTGGGLVVAVAALLIWGASAGMFG